MARLKLNMSFVFLIFLMASCQVTLSFNPSATEKVLTYLLNIDNKVKMVDFWKKLFTGVLDDGPSNDDILNEVKAVSNKISQLGIKLEQKIDEVKLMIPARVRVDNQIDAGIRDLVNRMENIDFLYDMYFMKIVNNQYDSIMLGEYVDKVLKLDSGPLYEIHKMHRLIHPDRTSTFRKGLLTNIKEKLEMINRERCDEGYSPQYWLFNVYINVMVTEIRAYLLSTLAYIIDEQRQNVSRETVISSNTGEFLNRINDHVRVLREELATTPRDIRRCDPPQHKRGETFAEFERLTQLYVANQDMFPDPTRCLTCNDIKTTTGDRLRKQPLSRSKYLEFRRCNGTVSKCGNFYPNPILGGDLCLLPENGSRDYQWVRSASDKSLYYGGGPQCNGEVVSLRQHIYEVWYKIGYEYCDFCVCECASEDPVLSIRSVNTRPQLSTFRANMVITGVRLVEKGRIIHMQIKEGKLIAGGKIEPGSEVWIPLEEMDFPSRRMVEITHNARIERTLSRGFDYELVSDWDNKFVLEDLMAPKGSVLVGIRFRNLRRNRVKFNGIGMEIMTAPFNWTTGVLGEPVWHSRNIEMIDMAQIRNITDNTFYPRYRDLPTRTTGHLPTLGHAVIQFQISDIVKDFGQSVVPFFDTLPIEGKPGLPLGGIGLFWKTKEDSGGFISPRIHNVDLSDYMSIENFNH